jgi:hypothetical protein
MKTNFCLMRLVTYSGNVTILKERCHCRINLRLWCYFMIPVEAKFRTPAICYRQTTRAGINFKIETCN